MDACKVLGESTSSIVAAARASPETLGAYSARCAGAVACILDAARTLTDGLMKGVVPAGFDKPSEQILNTLNQLANNRSNRRQGVTAAKAVAGAAAAIVNQAKATAMSTRDPMRRADIIMATEALANATAALAKAVRTGILPQHINALKDCVTYVIPFLGLFFTFPFFHFTLGS